MIIALMPIAGSALRKETVPSSIEVTEVCVVEGKNPAKRGKEVKAISSIFRIANLLVYYLIFIIVIIQVKD